MSSPEVEKFEITEEDYENEFNPKRFRQSKNQSIYGIWAKAEDSDDDDYRGFGSARGRNKKDFTAPVSFISGGFKMDAKEEKADLKAERDAQDQKDFNIESFRTSGFSGLGSRGRSGKQRHQNKTNKGLEEDGAFGHWERHTKGIGQRLLAKMGHVTGKGLGKNLQGIFNPVTAKKREGKGTLGYYGSERTKQSMQHFPTKPDSDEEETKEFKEQLQRWKKTDGESGKKKFVYKTANDVLGGKQGTSYVRKRQPLSDIAKVKVIDMTQKEQRVLSGYHAISQKHDRPDDEEDTFAPQSGNQEVKAFEMPELIHNLNLLVDMTEEDIIKNDRRLRYEQDMVINMNHEHEKLTTICEQEERQIRKLEQIVNMVDSLEIRTKEGCDNPLTLEECAEVFRKLQDDYYEEYKIYDLGVMAMAIVFPVMKKYFMHWKPLQSSEYGMETVRHWRELLEEPNRGRLDGQMDFYHKLMWEIWMPCLRTAVSSWNVREPDPIIEILENWLPLLPDWILDNILDQLILPRLNCEVDAWNPMTDTMPIHSWLHPWLPLAKYKLEPLYTPIRHKLANALKNWHPSDPSAKMILQPWRGVFPQGHMDAFIVKNILPKLQICMQEFVVNPHQQHLDGWKWVMSWSDVLPLHNMVSLLQNHFFPKWIQVLCTWLSSTANYDEVTKWYTGWKSMFSDKLLGNITIKEQFSKALELMNRTVTGPIQSGLSFVPRPPAPYPMAAPPPPPPQELRKTYDSIKGATFTSTVPSNFKDLIEKKAGDNGIIFHPLPNKTYEAKQVYRFGSVQMYLDRSVIFMFDRNMWVPTSLENLIAKGNI